MLKEIIIVCLIGCLVHVQADIPVHCLYEEYLGEWTYYLGSNGKTNSINCTESFPITQKYTIYLKEPDVAVDGEGNSGFWTRIYDEGVEVVINDKKFFAFSKFFVPPDGNESISFCNETFQGWYHNVDGSDWGCYYGHRISQNEIKPLAPSTTEDKPVFQDDLLFVQDEATVKAINTKQNKWTAKKYPQFVGKTIKQMRQIAGGSGGKKMLKELLPAHLKNIKASKVAAKLDLPINFDWRNVKGVNYVSPVRTQAQCGSCYSFAVTGMLEARTRILTNNTDQVVLSPQGVISCSEYSQGCNGGFDYLVAKYAEDFFLVEEQCFPYRADDQIPCSHSCNDTKQQRKASNYYYVGGYYGACTEELMKEEIYKNGPISVSFEVYPEFFSYSGGVYVCSEYEPSNKRSQNVAPWQETNHAVVIVGWGVDNSTSSQLPYWTVKNSWGEEWGDAGYFRIKRGTDECAIESMAFAASPVLSK